MRLNLDMSLRKATSHISKGQPIEAASILAEVLERFPSNARAQSLVMEINKQAIIALPNNIFTVINNFLRQGRHAEVLRITDNLPASAAGSCDLQFLLGQTYSALKRNAEASLHFDFATILQPKNHHYWMAAGNHAYFSQNYSKAKKCFETTLKIEENNIDVMNNLGMTLAAQGDFVEAVVHFENAQRLSPASAKVSYNYANALRDAGQLEEAVAKYRRAIELEPQYATAANNLGTVLHQLGRDKEAEEAYLMAVQACPEYAQAHRNLSAVHRYQSDDPLIKVMDQQLAAVTSEHDKMYLNFARFKAHEDMGEFPQAFDRLIDANAIRKKLLGYDMVADKLLFKTLRELFTVPLPIVAAHIAQPRPVFILGMMRSGTTLVEQILSSHSAVHGAGELETMGQLCLPIMEKFHSTKEIPKEKDLQQLRSRYLNELGKINAVTSVITDKMPANFLWIGFILASIPEARIIHMQRDPMATCWSIFNHYFSSNGNGYAFDLRDVAAYWHLYNDLMKYWRNLFPNQILDVPYEQLTEEPENWSRKIVEFSGLQWEDACLNFHLNNRAVRTASASQVRKKIYKGSSEAWRKYEPQLSGLKADLGIST